MCPAALCPKFFQFRICLDDDFIRWDRDGYRGGRRGGSVVRTNLGLEIVICCWCCVLWMGCNEDDVAFECRFLQAVLTRSSTSRKRPGGT